MQGVVLICFNQHLMMPESVFSGSKTLKLKKNLAIQGFSQGSICSWASISLPSAMDQRMS